MQRFFPASFYLHLCLFCAIEKILNGTTVISGARSDHFYNCATTTALVRTKFNTNIKLEVYCKAHYNHMMTFSFITICPAMLPVNAG